MKCLNQNGQVSKNRQAVDRAREFCTRTLRGVTGFCFSANGLRCLTLPNSPIESFGLFAPVSKPEVRP